MSAETKETGNEPGPPTNENANASDKGTTGKEKIQQAGRKPSLDSSNSAMDPEVRGSSFIGEYLFELWKNQCLCDVKLQVGHSSYLAHKIVLAAFSEIFCPTTANIPPTVCVEVPGTTPEALYQVLQYLYTSEMELTDSSLEPIIGAACFMGITDVVEMVKEILSNPTMDNLEMYIGIRKRLGMSYSILNFINLVRENFIELSDHESFLEMTDVEIGTLLEDPGVMVDSEMDTLCAVIKWLEYNVIERQECAGYLLSRVSLECIDPKELAQIVEKKKDLFEDHKSQEVLMEAFKRIAMNKDAEAYGGVSVCPCDSKMSSGYSHDPCEGAATKPPRKSCDPCGGLSRYREGGDGRWGQSQSHIHSDSGEMKTFNEIRKSFAAKRRLDCTVAGDSDTAPETCCVLGRSGCEDSCSVNFTGCDFSSSSNQRPPQQTAANEVRENAPTASTKLVPRKFERQIPEARDRRVCAPGAGSNPSPQCSNRASWGSGGTAHAPRTESSKEEHTWADDIKNRLSSMKSTGYQRRTRGEPCSYGASSERGAGVAGVTGPCSQTQSQFGGGAPRPSRLTGSFRNTRNSPGNPDSKLGHLGKTSDLIGRGAGEGTGIGSGALARGASSTGRPSQVGAGVSRPDPTKDLPGAYRKVSFCQDR